MRTAPLRRLIFGTIVGATALVSVSAGSTSATAVDPPAIEPTVEPLAASASLAYTPITPLRILDTREGLGATLPRLPIPDDVGNHPCLPGETDIVGIEFVFGSDGSVTTVELCSDFTPPTGEPPLQAGKTITLDVANGLGREPSEISAVVMNVTVDQPSALSFLSVWPNGTTRPGTSNLNFSAGQTIANLVTVKVSSSGRVDIFNRAGFTHVIADVVGYHAVTSDFVGLDPDRILDTREGVGAPARQVGPDGTIDLQVTGRGGVPATGVGGVVMNVTATNPTQNSFGTVYPTGVTRPLASNVNYNAGVTVPNLVMTKLGAGGKVTLFNRFGSVDFLADVVGYYRADATYVSLTPDRILDTRKGVGAPAAKVGTNGEIALGVLGVGGVPASGVRAVVMNVTGTEASSASFITVWPNGETRPTASSINLVPGKNIPNLVVAKVGSGGSVKLFNRAGATHMIADVVGYIDATAGVELPADLKVPATTEWSTSTWTVKSAVLRERTDDEDFRLDDTVPFVLDVQMRVTNLSEAESQRFDGNTIALTTDDGPLEPLRSPSVFLSKLTSADVSLSAPINWGTDLTGLDIDLGGSTYVRGRLGLTGPTPPVDPAVPLGKIIQRTLPGGVLCNATNFGTPRSGAVTVSTTSAAWRTTIPAPNDVSGAIDVLQSRQGTRWLLIDLALDGSECFSANVFGGAFQLDVDGSFSENRSFVNALLQRSTDTVRLAYEVPVDAQLLELRIGNATSTAEKFVIPVDGLG